MMIEFSGKNIGLEPNEEQVKSELLRKSANALLQLEDILKLMGLASLLNRIFG